VDPPPPETQSTSEPFIPGLKHRLLAFLAKQAKMQNNLMQFFFSYNQYNSLVMWKMQFLDTTHLLIKFGSIEGVNTRTPSDVASLNAFFVVYNMVTTDIVGVYPNTSLEFAEKFQQFCEYFRACRTMTDCSSTCSNNCYVRETLERQRLAVVNAKHGGHSQATRRILSVLPFSPQLWNESPYFDQSLFSYDEKFISAADRLRPCAEYPIKFYSRRSGALKFKLSPGIPNRCNRSKRFASYVFHPFLPFIISVQHALFQPCIVNFHFRKCNQTSSPFQEAKQKDCSKHEKKMRT